MDTQPEHQRKERPMSTPVVKVTPAELHERRANLLARLGVSLEEIERRAAAYTLTADEWPVWEELREIAFLLNDR